MFEIFLLGIVISVVLATCITILMNKIKKYILYLSIILISIDIVQYLSIICFDNNLIPLIISDIFSLLIFLIAYFVIIHINKNNIVKKLKNELNKEYNEFSVKALFKKEVISGNEIDVGAIRYYYDFSIDVKEYNC